RRHVASPQPQGLLAVGLAAAIDRQLERDDFALLGVEVRIVLANTNSTVFEALGVSSAIGKWRFKQALAVLHGEVVRRKILQRLPLCPTVGIQRIGAVGVILDRHVGKALLIVTDERLPVVLR